MNHQPAAGVLYIVATPIGNLEDITLRALRILENVDLIACEDTRRTRGLLSHYSISTPTISYYREKERKRSVTLLEQLRRGRSVALVSDAGTPALSDPGAVVVRKARRAGIRVVPIPGPSALTASVAAAGLRETTFCFLGFPPASQRERRQLFKSLAPLRRTLVFYESPHRIRATVRELLSALGDRDCLFCRELTKIHEEIRESGLAALSANLEERRVKGEIVLLVAGKKEVDQPETEDLDELLRWHRHRGNSLKQAVSDISRDLGLKRTPVYRRALEIWHKE